MAPIGTSVAAICTFYVISWSLILHMSTAGIPEGECNAFYISDYAVNSQWDLSTITTGTGHRTFTNLEYLEIETSFTYNAMNGWTNLLMLGVPTGNPAYGGFRAFPYINFNAWTTGVASAHQGLFFRTTQNTAVDKVWQQADWDGDRFIVGQQYDVVVRISETLRYLEINGEVVVHEEGTGTLSRSNYIGATVPINLNNGEDMRYESLCIRTSTDGFYQPSEPTATTSLLDLCDVANDWSVQSSSFSVSGSCAVTSAAASPSTIVSNDNSFADFTLEWKQTMFSGHNSGVLLRALDYQNGYLFSVRMGDLHYYVGWVCNGGQVCSGSQYYAYPIPALAAAGMGYGKEMTMRVEMNAWDVCVYLNDVLLRCDNDVYPRWSSGSIVFRGWGAVATYSDVSLFPSPSSAMSDLFDIDYHYGGQTPTDNTDGYIVLKMSTEFAVGACLGLLALVVVNVWLCVCMASKKEHKYASVKPYYSDSEVNA